MSNSLPTDSWRKSVDVLYSAETIAKRVSELGAAITRDHAQSAPLLVGILRGSFVFFADLVRAIDLPVSCDFMGISSYGDATKSSGVVKITQDISQDVTGRDVILVEDIVDTGLTMQYLLNYFGARKPNSVKVCTLLEKPGNAKVKVPISYMGFSIANEFVVGYGLDYAGKYRNLPFIGIYRNE